MRGNGAQIAAGVISGNGSTVMYNGANPTRSALVWENFNFTAATLMVSDRSALMQSFCDVHSANINGTRASVSGWSNLNGWGQHIPGTSPVSVDSTGRYDP